MASSSTFDEDLRESFLKVEDELLDAVMTGSESSTADFINRLSSLTQSVAHGIANRLLSSRTISLVRRVASNANVLAHNLRELGPRTKSVEIKRQDDLSDLFARFSLNEKDTKTDHRVMDTKSRRKKETYLQKKRHPSSKPNSPLERSASEETLVPTEPECDVEILPPHIFHGLCWLIKNLHNPYPSHKEKACMAEASGVPIRTLETWFVNTRRRIGWTALLDSHFKGSRALMVDAAYGVYEKWDDGLVSEEVSQQFQRIRSNLMGLYEGKMQTSNCAKELDDMLIQVHHEGRSEHEPATKKRKRTPSDIEHKTVVDGTITCSNVDTNLGYAFEKPVQVKRQCVGSSVFYNNDSSPSLMSSSSTNSSPHTQELLSVDFPPAPSTDSFSRLGLMDKSSVTQEMGSFVVASNCKRLRENDQEDQRSAKRSRIDTREPKYNPRPDLASAIDDLPVPDCSTDLSQLWSLDFSIPTGVALDQITGGSLDLDVHDWSKCMDTNSLGLDLMCGDVTNGPITETVSHSPGNTEDIFGELLRGLQAESILPVSDPWNSRGYPEVEQLLTGSDVALPTALCNANTTIAPSPPIVDIFSLNNADNGTLCSMAHSCATVSDFNGFDFSGSNPPMEGGLLLMEDYGMLVNEVLRSDRDAKLERLRLLKEEKDKLAEEEKRLQEDLSVPSIFTNI